MLKFIFPLLFILSLQLAIPSAAADSEPTPAKTLGCLSMLAGIVPSENEVLALGHLHHQWQPNSLHSPVWSIVEESVQADLSANPTDYLHRLKPGDQVFIVSEDGDIVHHGYYGEAKQPVPGWKLDAVQRPQLFEDRELTKVILDAENFETLFYQRCQAIALVSMSPVEKAIFNDRRKALDQLRAKFETSPERVIKVGTREITRASFEVPLRGTVYYVPVEPHNFHFAPWFPIPQTAFRYRIKNGPADVPLEEGDRVFLLDENGEIFFATTINYLDFYRLYPSEFLESVQKASGALVLASKSHKNL